MLNVKKTCNICQCFDAMPGVRDSNEPLVGYCRRQPPKVVVYEEEPDCLWPIVSQGDWCIEGFIENPEAASRQANMDGEVGSRRTEGSDSSTVVRISRGKGEHPGTGG